MRQSNRVHVMIVPRIVVGGLLVLFGIALALDQLGVVAAHHVWRYWPAALILLGLAGLQRGEGRRLVTPLVLIVVGTWLLLNTLGLVRVDIWDFFWPLLLVAIGARILMRRNEPVVRDAALGMPPPVPPLAPPPDSAPSGPAGVGTGPSGDSAHASLFALLGSSKRRWGRFPFRSADATAMLGGCELDLRDALIESTGSAVVDVFVLMGGVEILVPPNWTVSLEIAPVLGSAEDSTRTVPSMPTQQLIVRGTVVMGGVEISN